MMYQNHKLIRIKIEWFYYFFVGTRHGMSLHRYFRYNFYFIYSTHGHYIMVSSASRWLSDFAGSRLVGRRQNCIEATISQAFQCFSSLGHFDTILIPPGGGAIQSFYVEPFQGSFCFGYLFNRISSGFIYVHPLSGMLDLRNRKDLLYLCSFLNEFLTSRSDVTLITSCETRGRKITSSF